VSSLEAVEGAAQLPLVEIEPLAEISGRDVGVLGDLVEQAGIGEPVRRLVEADVEQANLPGVEPVEVADGADAGSGDAGHGTSQRTEWRDDSDGAAQDGKFS
jgi:hypothetical protein